MFPLVVEALAELIADVDEIRWVVANEGATGRCRGDDRGEGCESGGTLE